jgi:lysophospholipase L1-like esterase
MGDSFTFGDGVRQMDRWPNQLMRILRPELDLDLVANLAARTVASKQLIEQQLPKLQQLEPGFVSVQVGGNDAYFAYPPDDYAANMRTILDEVLELVPAERVVVVTTPDFTLTEVEGAADEAEARSARVAELNEIVTQVAADRGIATVDIAPVADRVTFDPTLVASDGSHPSAKQYAGWADLIAPIVRRLFRELPAQASAGASGAVPSVPIGPSPEPSLTQLVGPTASPVLITS